MSKLHGREAQLQTSWLTLSRYPRPSHAAMVGRGLLSAAVSGNVFACAAHPQLQQRPRWERRADLPAARPFFTLFLSSAQHQPNQEGP